MSVNLIASKAVYVFGLFCVYMDGLFWYKILNTNRKLNYKLQFNSIFHNYDYYLYYSNPVLSGFFNTCLWI